MKPAVQGFDVRKILHRNLNIGYYTNMFICKDVASVVVAGVDFRVEKILHFT